MNDDGFSQTVKLAFAADDFDELLFYPTFASRLATLRRHDEAEELIRFGYSLLGVSPSEAAGKIFG